MSLFSLHGIDATVQANYNVHTDALTFYSQGFETSQDSWTNGASTTVGRLVSTGHTGSAALLANRTTGTTNLIAQRTLTGLTVGKSYTATGWACRSGAGTTTTATLGITGIGTGTGVVLTALATGWLLVTYQFTATATSHVLVFTVANATTGSLTAYLDDVVVSRDAYDTATPLPALAIQKARATMDDAWSPYVQVTLTCAIPTAEQLAAIDPRSVLRVSVTATQTFAAADGTDLNSFGFRAPVTRTFDLSLQNAEVDYNDDTITLTLESDEALLLNFGLPGTVAERTTVLSVRTAVAYALNKIGASIYTGVLRTNRYTDPECTTTTGKTAANGAALSISSGRLQVACPANSIADSGVNIGVPAVVAGETITYSVDVFAQNSDTYRLSVQGSTQTGSPFTSVTLASGESTRMSITVTHTASGTPNVYVLRSAGGLARTFQVDNILVEKSPTMDGYFSGASTDPTLTYDYAWTGGANASSSTRNSHAWDFTLPFTPLVLATNLARNPSGEFDATGYTAVPGTTGVATTTSVAPSTTTAYGSKVLKTAWTTATTAAGGGVYVDVPVTAGHTYGFLFGHVKSSITNRLQMRVEWRISSTVLANVTGSPIVATAGAINNQKLSNNTAPDFATQARIYIESVAGTSFANWSIGSYLEVDGFLAKETSATLVSGDYFDGDTTDTSTTRYDWSGTQYLSSSTKTDISNADATIWQPGVSAWDWLKPLLAVSNLRLYCTPARHWHLESNTVQKDGLIILADTANVTKASNTISLQDDSPFYTGVSLKYSWTDANGVSQVAYDSAGTGTKMLAIEFSTAYPGAGAASYILSRATGKGRVYSVEANSDYSTAPGMGIQIQLTDNPLQTGTVSSVQWDWPTNRMTVKSKGLTDTPAGAWVLLTQTWAAQTNTWAAGLT